MWATRHTAAGRIAAAQTVHANAIQYAVNLQRMRADEAAEKAAESPQESLDL